jgi:hypothetical protein
MPFIGWGTRWFCSGEAAYSACKALLRKCAERTEQALSRRIGQFIRRLQPDACANFFAHAGYAT